MINQMRRGIRVFTVHHNDGTANPKHYFLQCEGEVHRVNNSVVKFGEIGAVYNYAEIENQFLRPNRDGFCYFIAELENMEQYQDGKYYKVPAKTLKDHMKTYKSPVGW